MMATPLLARSGSPAAELSYLSGFGNEHASEALTGALPVGRFSPQRVPYGLYAEKLTATAFTVPRAENRRSWLYRIRPSVVHGRFRAIDRRLLRSAPLTEAAPTPNPLRWDPFPVPDAPADFVDGLATIAANGDVHAQAGLAVHVYLANRSMEDRFFYDADGELLIVPQQGRVRLHTECGVLEAAPGEILTLPRGMKCRVVLPDGPSRGLVGENYGAPLRLPERGPVGSDGFANDRDFLAPIAAYEDREGRFELVAKFQGALHACEIGHSPLDVVAWVGDAVPYRYDLGRFNVMGTVSFDHPDPSIYTVMSSPSDTPGVANLDFCIFPARWMVAEDTFRPPWFHRNVMSELMSLVHGDYDAKGAGFSPGGISLHNCMTPHGPDAEAFERATRAELAPVHYRDTLAFMLESRYAFCPTRFALEAPELQADYAACWQGLGRRFTGEP